VSGLAKRPAGDLAALAVEIRAEHDAAQGAWRTAVEHAINCGRLLLEAKAQLSHGEWGRWLEENFPASRRTAQGYMQLAREAADARRVADLGVRGALKEIATATKVPCPDCGRRVASDRLHECPDPPGKEIVDDTIPIFEIRTERQRQLAEAAKRRLEMLVGQTNANGRFQEDGGLARVLRVNQAMAVSSAEEIKGYIEVIEAGERALRALRRELARYVDGGSA
jgi:hypothetical protein